MLSITPPPPPCSVDAEAVKPESDGAAAKAINWLPPDSVAVVIPDVAAARVAAPGRAWPTAALGIVSAPAATIIPPLKGPGAGDAPLAAAAPADEEFDELEEVDELEEEDDELDEPKEPELEAPDELDELEELPEPDEPVVPTAPSNSWTFCIHSNPAAGTVRIPADMLPL
jgi:hypothetical protein